MSLKYQCKGDTKTFSKHEINLHKLLSLEPGNDEDDETFFCDDEILISDNFQYFALFLRYFNIDEDSFVFNDSSSSQLEELILYIIIVNTQTEKCIYSEKSSGFLNERKGIFSPDSLLFAFFCEDRINVITLKNQQLFIINESIESFNNISFDFNQNLYYVNQEILVINSLSKGFIDKFPFEIEYSEDFFYAKSLFGIFLVLKNDYTQRFQIYNYKRQKVQSFWNHKQSDYEANFQVFKNTFLLDHVEEFKESRVWFIAKGRMIRKLKRNYHFLSSKIETQSTLLQTTLELYGNDELPLTRTFDFLRGRENMQVQHYDCYIHENCFIPLQISSNLYVQLDDGNLMYFK